MKTAVIGQADPEMACVGKCEKLWPVGTGVQLVGLALMTGGMLALGAFTAPVVFGQLPREQAGPIMATIFRRYDVVLLVALGLTLLGEAMRVVSKCAATVSKLSIVRYVLMALLAAGILFSTLKVNADIERMNRAGWHRDYSSQGRTFEATHKLSESLYKVDMLAALLLLILTPFTGFKAGRSGTDA
ncbi:MAG TPA: DUF4149 domain-containing protein [Coleofasciculaceae cyanobacterium]